MPDQNNGDAKSSDSNQQSTNDNPTPTSKPPEHEPAPADISEKDLVKKIVEESKNADEKAKEQVQSQIEEVRLGSPEPEIPKEAEEAGVKSPDKEASNVINKGSTLDLSITEEEYEKGLHQKVTGKVKQKVVFGVSSLVALTMWVGRMVKMVHKHTTKITKVVFKGKGDNNAN